MFHRWRWIDFNQPRIQIFINHQIIAEKFKRPLLKLLVLNALQTPLNYQLHFSFKPSLLPYIRAIGLSKILSECFWPPHVSFSYFNSVFSIFRHRIVCQMHKSVKIFRIVLGSWKPYIRLVPEPNCERAPRSHYDPYSDIKLSSLYNHRIFNVFLSNPLMLFWTIVQNFSKIVVNCDPPSSAKTRRFEYPNIMLSIHVILWKLFLALV